jgi:hypothetical protein
VRVEAWFAIRAAFSSVPPLFRYAVMPVARKVWLPTRVATPAALPRLYEQRRKGAGAAKKRY